MKHSVAVTTVAANLAGILFLSSGANVFGQNLPSQFPQGIPPKHVRILLGERFSERQLFAQNTQATKPIQPAPSTKRCSPDCEELLAKARQKAVHIILSLDAPNLPRTAPPSAPKDERRRSHQALSEAVNRVQDAFLAKLAGHNVKRIYKGRFTPDISMEVDAATLEIILRQPEVRSVGEIPSGGKFSLFDTGPLIGATQA